MSLRTAVIRGLSTATKLILFHFLGLPEVIPELLRAAAMVHLFLVDSTLRAVRETLYTICLPEAFVLKALLLVWAPLDLALPPLPELMITKSI